MTIATIEAFDFDTEHQVIGFGRARHNLDQPAEVQIEVFLSPHRAPSGAALNGSVQNKWIGCGQLSLVRIGSLWLKKKNTGDIKSGLRKIAAKPSYAGFGTMAELGAATDGGPFPIIADMPCFRLTIEPEKTPLKWLWVPVTEVLRATFGVSSHFLVQMIGGVRSPDLMKDSAFFNRDLCKRVDEDTYRIMCTRNPTNLEALMIAASLSDANYRDAHDSVFRHLEAACEADANGAPLKMSFPFRGKETDWVFEGRYIPRQPDAKAAPDQGDISHRVKDAPSRPDESNKARARNAFLVTRIFHIKFPVPFKCVEICVASPTLEKSMPPSEGRTILKPAGNISLQSLRPSATGAASIEIKSDSDGLVSSRPVEFIRITGDVEKGTANMMVYDSVDERIGSTADRQQGGGVDVVHVVLKRGKIPSSESIFATDQLQSSRVATFEAITALALHSGWTLENAARDVDGLPLMQKIGKKAVPMLLMTVVRPHGNFFVADVGTTLKNGSALGLIAPINSPLSARESMDAILETAGKHGGAWRGKTISGFSIVAVARMPSGIWRRHEKYVELLAQAINRLP